MSKASELLKLLNEAFTSSNLNTLEGLPKPESGSVVSLTLKDMGDFKLGVVSKSRTYFMYMFISPDKSKGVKMGSAANPSDFENIGDGEYWQFVKWV